MAQSKSREHGEFPRCHNQIHLMTNICSDNKGLHEITSKRSLVEACLRGKLLQTLDKIVGAASSVEDTRLVF